MVKRCNVFRSIGVCFGKGDVWLKIQRQAYKGRYVI
jgi:hypothetical protein